MAQVHGVCNQKGGSGKTTTAVNLCAAVGDALQTPDEPPAVYLATTDPQGSAIWWCRRVDQADREAAEGKAGKRGRKRKPMPFDFHDEVLKPGDLAKLKRTNQYQHIFVDTPGTLDPHGPDGPDPHTDILSETLTYVDDVVVPMDAAPLSFEPTTRTIESLLKPRGIPFVVVVTQLDMAKAPEAGEGTFAYIKSRGWPHSQVPIRHYKLHLNASMNSEVCTQYPSNEAASNARQDFYKLALDLGYGRTARSAVGLGE